MQWYRPFPWMLYPYRSSLYGWLVWFFPTVVKPALELKVRTWNLVYSTPTCNFRCLFPISDLVSILRQTCFRRSSFCKRKLKSGKTIWSAFIIKSLMCVRISIFHWESKKVNHAMKLFKVSEHIFIFIKLLFLKSFIIFLVSFPLPSIVLINAGLTAPWICNSFRSRMSYPNS